MTKFVSVLLLVATLSGAPRSAPTVDDSLSFPVPSSPQISPDGSQVVYQLSRTNWRENTFESDLWIADVAPPHNRRKLDAGPGWNGEPRWSPDGQTVAFLGDRSGKRELFIIPARGPAHGSEARKLTSVESGIGEFRWAPDSASLAFTADTDPDRNAERARRYGDFEIVKEDPAGIAGLWRVSVPPLPDAPLEKPEALLVDGKFAVSTFAWSPNGTRIAFQADGIYVLDVATHTVKAVASGAGPYRNPVWSPDGKSIAFETAGGAPGFYYANWFIAKVPACGGTVEPLTKGFDENADLAAWTPAGIFFGALRRTASQLFSVDPASHAIRRVTQLGDVVDQQFSVTPDGLQFAFVRSEIATFPEIFAATADGRATRVTDLSADAAPFQFARRELVRWKSTDGTEIEGILYKPANFNAAKKYPLLVAIHGGPVALDQPALRPDRYYPLEQFIARGALVLRPNYRGSAGYGAIFRALPVRNLGTGDAADIVSGVDSLIGKGFIDPDRVGAMGWSEGGYISAFLATASNRFAAVSVGAGVSDWTAYYVNTDITPFTRQYLKATPWSEPEVYRTASPVTYVNKANTPVLIQHGEEDRRVPVTNAYELRQALEDRKVPVRMIVYKGMGHAIDRPKQQRAVMEQNLEWFDRWIFGGTKKPSDPVSISRSITSKAIGDSQ